MPAASRVRLEFERRADLLAEQLPAYVSMVLSAAADHVAPPSAAPTRFDEGEPLPYGHEAADVINLHRWGR